ncbi:hypothetical protein VX159_07500 [Dechloromonas sp. ZY10]|uniref:tautomerase family protein n=1 Tax=Dechloromonas aquae TaxID=2664436 RepID=UPI00352872D7
MPYLQLTLNRPLATDQQQTLAAAATRLLSEQLGKRGEVTAVRIEQREAAWFIAGKPVAAPWQACHGEVCITAGSNRAEEKAAFIAALNALLERECGPLAEASYLVIREIPAENWGYAGQTQAARRLAQPRL